jgi:hypothetical protein
VDVGELYGFGLTMFGVVGEDFMATASGRLGGGGDRTTDRTMEGIRWAGPMMGEGQGKGHDGRQPSGRRGWWCRVVGTLTRENRFAWGQGWWPAMAPKGGRGGLLVVMHEENKR